MANLESVIQGIGKGALNLGRGFLVGAANAIDPVGNLISGVDYQMTGVGPSDPRALRTIHNAVAGAVYNPEEEVKIASGYIPRAVGTVAGVGAVGFGLYSLYSAFGFAAAAAIPFVAGIYSSYVSLRDYIRDFRKGEKIGGKQEKAKFYDGFKLGWHFNTHLYMNLLHGIESGYTGRSMYRSRLASSIKESSKYTRRNFASVAGNIVGSLAGGIVSVITLGIFPLYQSVRDSVRTVEARKASRKSSAMPKAA